MPHINEEERIEIQLRHNREIANFQLFMGFLILLFANFIFDKINLGIDNNAAGSFVLLGFIFYAFFQNDRLSRIESELTGKETLLQSLIKFYKEATKRADKAFNDTIKSEMKSKGKKKKK